MKTFLENWLAMSNNLLKQINNKWIFVAILAISTPVNSASLKSVVEQTLATNPEVLADNNQRMAREQELRQARSGYGPSLDITGGIGVETSDNSTTRAAGSDETLTRQETAIQIRQMVFDGFATKREVARQHARVDSSAYTLMSTTEQVSLRTTETYLEVLKRMELLELAKTNLETHKHTRDQITLRSRSGVGRKADADQVTGRYALAMANVISEESNLADARSNYLRVTGELPNDLLLPDVEKLPVPDSVEAAVEVALAAHPTLKSAEADVEATQAQHQATNNTLYPRIDLEAGQSWNKDLDGQPGDNNDSSVMLRMRYLLFASGREQARRKQTAHLLDEAKEIRNNTRRQVVESIRLSWSQFQTQASQLEYLQQHVDSTKSTLDAYRKQFNIGKRSLLDLLDSENELFDASRSYVNTRYDNLFARYRIQVGLGRLLESLGVDYPGQAELTAQR
ncbi:MAG: TolC family outer membrane protein [Gammaproteobacteria bacterium]